MRDRQAARLQRQLAKIQAKDKFTRVKSTLLKTNRTLRGGFASGYKAPTAFRQMAALEKLGAEVADAMRRE